jgi:8-oxo-dGTP pyrophosphatase MutT (NUDIX family)
VFRDLGKFDEVKAEVDALRPEKGDTQSISEDYLISTKLIELHCVAICIDQKGRILAGKRSAIKRRLPGLWEFGCGQLRINETFEDCIKRCYKEEFGISVSVVNPATPIATFYMRDVEEKRVIPGIIFLARCDDPERLRPNKSSHSEVQWFSREEISGVSADQKVPDFDRNTDDALAAWSKAMELSSQI